MIAIAGLHRATPLNFAATSAKFLQGKPANTEARWNDIFDFYNIDKDADLSEDNFRHVLLTELNNPNNYKKGLNPNINFDVELPPELKEGKSIIKDTKLHTLYFYHVFQRVWTQAPELTQIYRLITDVQHLSHKSSSVSPQSIIESLFEKLKALAGLDKNSAGLSKGDFAKAMNRWKEIYPIIYGQN